MVRTTVSKTVRQRLLGSLVAVSTLAGSSLFAQTTAPAMTTASSEQAAAARWQDLREQIFPAKSASSPQSSATARPFPERTTLEQVGFSQTTSPASPGKVAPASGNRESGRVIHSFSDVSEPLAVPRFEGLQLVSLPEFLAQEQAGLNGLIAQQPIPPEPIPAAPPSGTPAPTAPGGELFGDQVDTLFQPITKIQPYQNYSPSAAAEGKVRYDYICPQPGFIPKDQQVSCPNMQSLPQQGSTDRNFATMQYCWVPTNVFHNPLYFEDPALERYGQQYPYGVQPFVSLGRFGIQFLGLPYQMAIDPVHREIYALGYDRPGDNTPLLEYRIPFNAKAAVVAGGVYTGFAFLIP